MNSNPPSSSAPRGSRGVAAIRYILLVYFTNELLEIGHDNGRKIDVQTQMKTKLPSLQINIIGRKVNTTSKYLIITIIVTTFHITNET